MPANHHQALSENLKALIWAVPSPIASTDSGDMVVVAAAADEDWGDAHAAVATTAATSADAFPSSPGHMARHNSHASSTATTSRSQILDYTTGGTSHMVVAIFNLVATIVGGGVLSVPFAFSACGGALWGCLWMASAALATDCSCLLLCWSARPPQWARADAAVFTKNDATLHHLVLSTYGQVGRAAFGPFVEVIVAALLFVFLVFVLIAYMVLVMDIWTPLILNFIQYFYGNKGNNSLLSYDDPARKKILDTEIQQDNYWGPYVLLTIIGLMSPFLVQRSLHALRYNCYIGFASVSVLCLALLWHALVSNTTATTLEAPREYSNYMEQQTAAQSEEITIALTYWHNVLWTSHFWLAPPASISNVITAFPILMLSFLCHFNVNPIQKALIQPTPARVSTVIHVSMAACAVLMTTFGVAGYAYVVGNTATSTVVQGNILLNCEDQFATLGKRDILLTMGRVGCGITIMLAMAIMMLPCRASLLEVLDSIVFAQYHRDAAEMVATMNHTNNPETTTPTTNDGDIPALQENNTFDSYGQHSEETPLLDNTHSLLRVSTTTNVEEADLLPPPPPSLSENPVVHYTTTFIIVLICYITAIKVPGVAIVWSLCGSCMAFGIAFALPCAFYLQILKQYQANPPQQLQPEDVEEAPSREQAQTRDEKEQQPVTLGGPSSKLDDQKTLVVEEEKDAQPSEVLAWSLLVVSIVAAVVCTTQTIQSMVDGRTG